jgi:hypothetical protein
MQLIMSVNYVNLKVNCVTAEVCLESTFDVK